MTSAAPVAAASARPPRGPVAVGALVACLLGACAELPPESATVSDAARRAPAPVLVPIGPLLSEAVRPSRARAAQAELAGRGARLRGAEVVAPDLSDLRSRAARLRGVRIPGPATGDLAARAARLRERAAALRAAPV